MDTTLNEIVTIRAELASLSNIMCEVAPTGIISAEITLPDFIGGGQYTGDYMVIPKAHAATVLPTNGKLMADDVTVSEIPYYETSNISGNTVYIADEV